MEPKERIEAAIKEIMLALNLDLSDDSLCDTPKRVAKMYYNEIFAGLRPETYPKITTVKNKFKYNQMLVEKKIEVFSVCEHHLVPIIGYACVGYIPKDLVLGLSKFNRIVRYWCQRPQVQERLTEQIKQDLIDVLQTEDVAVQIQARHLCVAMRGVRDTHSETVTCALGGKFLNDAVRAEFFKHAGS